MGGCRNKYVPLERRAETYAGRIRALLINHNYINGRKKICINVRNESK